MSQEQHKFQIAVLMQKYNYSFWCNASTSLATISFFCSAMEYISYTLVMGNFVNHSNTTER